jgi:ATP-binding cassette subfamily B multidrug efflux pump
VTSLIRWQSHWHVVRQSWPFFQNDFAGRIANRVMQTSNALRESVVSSIRAIWYIAIYGVAALVLMAIADWRLAIPTLLWFAGYAFFLRHFVPRMRDLAKASSEVRSHVMGRVVTATPTSYRQALRAAPRRGRVRARDDRRARGGHRAHMRLITQFMGTLATMKRSCSWAPQDRHHAVGLRVVSAGLVATALPLAWQIATSPDG